jgi:hypothetical protein
LEDEQITGGKRKKSSSPQISNKAAKAIRLSEAADVYDREELAKGKNLASVEQVLRYFL